MSGRKDRYSPNLGSPRFERSPPLSSNWRNKQARRGDPDAPAKPSCLWTAAPLANLLYSEWDNLEQIHRDSWANCGTFPQCSPKARFIKVNLLEFISFNRVYKRWPRLATGSTPTHDTFSFLGGVAKIDCQHTYLLEKQGWIWTYHRDPVTRLSASLANMFYAAVYDGTKSYSWEDSPVAAGTWKIRVVKITDHGNNAVGEILSTSYPS